MPNPLTVQVYNNNDYYIQNQQLPNPSTVQIYNNNEVNLYDRNQRLQNSYRVKAYNNNETNFYNRNQQLRNPSTVEIYNKNKVKTDEKFLHSHEIEPEDNITFKGVLYKRVDKPNNNINQEMIRGRMGRNNYRNNNNAMRYQRRINNRNINPNDYDKKSQNSKTEII